jgi:hypothetical protein
MSMGSYEMAQTFMQGFRKVPLLVLADVADRSAYRYVHLLAECSREGVY